MSDKLRADPHRGHPRCRRSWASEANRSASSQSASWSRAPDFGAKADSAVDTGRPVGAASQAPASARASPACGLPRLPPATTVRSARVDFGEQAQPPGVCGGGKRAAWSRRGSSDQLGFLRASVTYIFPAATRAASRAAAGEQVAALRQSSATARWSFRCGDEPRRRPATAASRSRLLSRPSAAASSETAADHSSGGAPGRGEEGAYWPRSAR